MTQQIEQSSPEYSGQWWRYGHVWLLIGLVAFAVTASFTLLHFALSINRIDTVYTDPLHPQDGSVSKVERPHLLPAEEARNHAATGGAGAPDLKSAPRNKQGAGNEPVDD